VETVVSEETHRMKTARRHSRHKFTLIALFVVITIIAILAALLLPSLAICWATAGRTIIARIG